MDAEAKMEQDSGAAPDVQHLGSLPSIAATLDRLVERAPGLVVLLCGPDHVFEYANPAYLRLIKQSEVVGRRFRDMVPELAEQGYLELLDRVYQTGEPFSGQGLETWLHPDPGGPPTKLFFDFVYQPVIDPCGKVVGIFGQGADVTDRVLAEQALRASEARFAGIFSQVTVGIAQTDLTGRLLLVNERQCQILGRPSHQLLGMRIQDVTHPEDRDNTRAMFERLIATGQPFVIEKRYVRPDGATVWARNNVSLMRDAEGLPHYVTAVVADITQERMAARELQRSQALSEAVLAAALDSIVIISEDSRVMEWNVAAERTFGFTRGEAVGHDLCDLIIPPEHREAHRHGMARYLATGVGPVIGRRVELEALRRDGQRLPVELAISPITLEGRTIFTAYLRDITARREAEASLRDSEHRLRATYENAFAGIGEVDREGRFLRVNEQLRAITGYSQDELLQRSIWDITHPDDHARERDLFFRHMAGELPRYNLEKRYVHKQGHEVWIELAASTADDELGRPVYGIRVVRDVTEHRRWSERQRLLVNELNHRVKNTLATVQSIAVQSARTSRDSQAAQSAFLSRLMALSRAHDVLTAKGWEGADLSDVVASSTEPFSGGERFSVTGPSVWLEPGKALAFSLALHELATNASKYGALTRPEGQVSLEWYFSDEGGTRLVFVWRETGGPIVHPPSHRGFGSRLLERGLAGQLGGKVELDFGASGITCRVELAL
jgi:PAS domain S-box-containing protein